MTRSLEVMWREGEAEGVGGVGGQVRLVLGKDLQHVRHVYIFTKTFKNICSVVQK